MDLISFKISCLTCGSEEVSTQPTDDGFLISCDHCFNKEPVSVDKLLDEDEDF